MLVQVLFHPAEVYRKLARDRGARGSLWRKPLALLFALGCFVSIGASGRLTVRLILDGAVSFGFVVVIEMAALAIVTRTRVGREPGARAGTPFARDVDVFFIGNAPWLWWLLLLGTVLGVVPPRDLGPWLRAATVGSLIPAVWSMWIDYHFFREVLMQSPGRAGRALLVNRAVGWIAAIGIFLGIAIWSYLPYYVARLGL